MCRHNHPVTTGTFCLVSVAEMHKTLLPPLGRILGCINLRQQHCFHRGSYKVMHPEELGSQLESKTKQIKQQQ